MLSAIPSQVAKCPDLKPMDPMASGRLPQAPWTASQQPWDISGWKTARVVPSKEQKEGDKKESLSRELLNKHKDLIFVPQNWHKIWWNALVISVLGVHMDNHLILNKERHWTRHETQGFKLQRTRNSYPACLTYPERLVLVPGQTCLLGHFICMCIYSKSSCCGNCFAKKAPLPMVQTKGKTLTFS